MEKRIFVPQLGREVVFDDSYPQDYVQNYIQQEIAKSATAQVKAPARQSLSLPQQAGAVLAGVGRSFWGTPVAALEGLGGITGSETLLNMAKGARESDLGKMLLDVPENYRDRTASTAGEVVGNLGSMFVPGAALKGAIAGRVSAGALSGLQGASEQVQRAEENRRAGMQVSPEDQRLAAQMGSMTGLLDLIPYSRLAGTIAPKGLKLAEAAAKSNVIARALGTGAIESGTEVSQQALQNLIESGYNPNQSMTEGLMENAVAGGAAGFGLDALLGLAAKRTGRNVTNRRQAMESVPLDALPDASSVGVRADASGDPLVEFLKQIEAPARKPMPEMPVEDYRRPAAQPEPMTPKEKKALELRLIQQQMQQTMPAINEIDVNSFPVEDYRTKKQAPSDPTQTTPAESPLVPPQQAEAVQPLSPPPAVNDIVVPNDLPAPGPREEVVQPKTVDAAAPVDGGNIDRFHAAYQKLTGENYGKAITLADVQQEMGITDRAEFTRLLADLDRGPGITADGAKLALPASTGTKGNNVYRDGDTSYYGIRFDKAGPPLDSDTYRIPTKDLSLDPARFQYKVEGIGQGGVGEEMKSVQKWDPKRAGVISVWKDPVNGKTYVVNGHHRYELASRMGVPDLRVQYLDAPNAKTARSMGALLNISEGRGTSVDAAKFMRDTGTTAEEMAAEGTSLTAGLAKEASALSNLAPSLFDDVVHGNLNVKRAAIVGQGLDSYSDQKAIIDLAAKKKATDAEVSEMIRLSKGDESTPSIPSDQGGLFGDESSDTSNNIYEVAQLSTAIRQRLSQEKKLFGIVGDKAAASKLGTAGNKIKADANKQISDQANEALIVYDKLSRSESPITQSLRDGARRIANGEPIDLVRDQTYTATRNAVASLLPGSKVGVRKTDARGKKADVQGVQPAQGQGEVERQSIDQKPTAPTVYTVDKLRQEIESGTKPEIALDIFNEMESLGGTGLFSTRLLDSISNPNGGKSEGTYSNRVIQLALESKTKDDLLRTLNHEAVHGMKQMGLFNDAEWAILNAAFNPNTALTAQEREEYGKLYSGDTAKINEEAIARGIERYAAGEINASRPAGSVASKAVDAMDRLGNVLKWKGYQNASDVMRSFRSGEMATREPNLPPPPSAPRTMQDYEKGQYDTQVKDGKTDRQVAQPTKNVGTGKRSTALADYLDQDEATETTQHSIVPQLPVSGTSPFGKPDERTALTKAVDTFVKKDGLGGIGLKLRQNVLDMRAGISELGRRAGDTTARSGSEAAVRNYDVAQDLSSSSLKNGALELVGTQGDGYFRSNGDTYNAPATIFKEAYEKGKLKRLFHYISAERADVLRSEGREKKISAADAAAWKAYGKDPDIANYAKRWKTFNDQMVDTLQKAGRIDAITAAKFKANLYLPFYRIEEGADGAVNFQSSGATLASSPRLERLKGSELEIGDPTDNIVRNVNTLTSMAMKNEAMQRVARDGIQTGFIRQVKEPVAGKPNIKVWVGGKEKHFEVLDPILYESITASRIPGSTAMTIAGFPARLLREGVTLDPVFMVNNPVRDSTMAWLQGYTDFPLQQILQSAYKAITNKPSFQRLERAGVIGNSIRGEGGAAGTGKTLRESYQGKTGKLHQLEEFSRKSEGITRNTVFESVMKRTGGDEAQAQFEARELLNFNRRGAHPVIQTINALIPFQNAVWQGADVLYRSGVRGHGSNPQMQKNIRNRMGVMAGLSVAYTVLASQMPEWQSASDEERDANWFLPGGVKVKIPFEAGYIAKVVPERLTAMYMGHDTGKEFLRAFGRFLFSTMKMDVIPQAMKPALEVETNYSTFRGKAIEPEYMRSKEKGQRFDENTSELAKKIGEHTDVLSPLQIDHLLRGYTGAVGVYSTQLAGLLANPEKAKASLSMAEREPHEIPVIGRFFQREDGPKQLGDYYETADKAEQAQNALKAGLEPTPERVRLAQIERAARPVDKQIKLLTAAEKKVRAAMATGAMTPEEARPLLREYRRKKSELAATVNKMAREYPLTVT